MIEPCADLFLFSSDHPHPEGTKHPIQRVEATMDGIDEAARANSYSANFAALYRATVPVQPTSRLPSIA